MDDVKTPWGRASGRGDTARPLPEPGPTLPEDTLECRFAGKGKTLLGLALRAGMFTILTAGFYRFWMKTRLRRWYWSSVRIGGLPLEYVGDPVEKLLGFLFAVVILAFYIGVVNLALMFASFSLFQGNGVAYLSSFVGVIPIWFYAQYRARRYVLARTRWRGMRFGLEPGAWGYAGRAVLHWAITAISLGLLWPRMTFALEKYKTDRTFFGDQRLRQGGRWQMLYPATRWIWIALALGLCAAAAIGSGSIAPGVTFGVAASFALLYGIIYYRVRCRILLTETKSLNGIRLTVSASPARVFLISLFGSMLAALVFVIPLGIVAALVLLAMDMGGPFQTLQMTPFAMDISETLTVVIGLAVYFTIFLLWTSLTHVCVTMPIFRHYAQNLRLIGAAELDHIRQRPRDEHAEAEGFAEALDVGASI